MATATYQLLVDWGRDDTYGHALSDVTSYVTGSLSWSIGMADSYLAFAAPSRLQVQLNNVDGVFSQDDTTAPFYGLIKRGLLAKIVATYQATSYTLFEGKISLAQFQPGAAGLRMVTLVVEDAMLELLDAEHLPPLLSSVTVDSVLTTFFNGGPIIYPYNVKYWVLGASILETNTTLFGGSLMNLTNFETGIETLTYVGDTSDKGEGVSAQGYLREVINGELGGRFWWDARNRQFAFHNRRHDFLNQTIDATYTQDEILGGDYRVGEDLLNSVVVKYTPRNLADSATAVWTSDQTPIRMKPGATFTTYPKFRNASGESETEAAQNPIAPVLGTDLVAVNDDNEARSNKFTVNTTFGASGCRLRVTNNGPEDLTITTLKIRGQAITNYDKNYVRIRDASSIYNNDLREATFKAETVVTEERATQYANHLLVSFKNLLTRFASITVGANKSPAIMSNVLSFTVGNKITVRDDWAGHNKNYVIVGEQHTIVAARQDIGERLHTVRWILKPAAKFSGWILGTSQLEVDTELVF